MTRPPRWTGMEEHKLRDLIEAGHGYTTCARRLKRTRVAIVLKVRRRAIPGVTKTRATLSARDAARVLGLGCAKTVTRWIAEGVLPARNAGMHRPLWRIDWDDLLTYLTHRYRWMTWHPDTITDLALREWAQELRAEPGQWLTPGQVAKRLHIGTAAVNAWIHKGSLPAVRYGNWWIWSECLVGFRVPGDQPYHKGRVFADSLHLRLLTILTDTPQGIPTLAAQLGAKPKSIAQALRRLQMRGQALRWGTNDRRAGSVTWTRKEPTTNETPILEARPSGYLAHAD